MLVNYYSNESNFHHYSATLTDFSLGERGYVNIESVYLLEEGSKTPVNEKGATVFSPYIEITWELFHPTAGMQFEFIGSFRIFYDGGSGAIVSITVGDETILSFEDGQKALLEWAKTVR